MDVAARLQLNLLVRPLPGVTLFKDVPEAFIPILWFEQRVTMLPEMADELKKVFIVPTIGYCVLGAVIFVGLIMIFWFPVATLLCSKRFDGADKSRIQPTSNVVHPPETSDSDRPLMFKDRKDVEMQPVAKRYNFDAKAAETDERFT